MAIPRKLWSQLKPATRARKLAYYAKQGLNPRQLARRYNSGTLGKQSGARGHRGTPEHPEEALKNPEKYRKYINRQDKVQRGETAEDYAYRINESRDKAYESMRRLREYVYYNDNTVRANVYGGDTAESGPVPGMDIFKAMWTASADLEEIRSMASDQYRANPWWYH